jgi:hypothetical protein
VSLQSPRVFPVNFASGTSLSSAIDTGGGYLFVSLEIKSNTSSFNTLVGSPVWLQGSDTLTGTYRRFYEVYTNTVASPFSITSGVCNAVVPIPLFNMRYVAVEISGTVTANTASIYNIICSDSL